jgi:protein-S-isoprenylcysteine O-methyltransferase Ste14
MRLNRPFSSSDPSQWRQFVDFALRRRVRILATVVVALLVDYCGGRILQHDLADVHSGTALFGLACILGGCALLAWAAGSRCDQFQSTLFAPSTLIKDPRFVGVFLSIVGLSLTIDDPKNIFLLLGPVILLDLVRLRREDYEANHSDRTQLSHQPIIARTTHSWHAIPDRFPRSWGKWCPSPTHLATLCVVPIVTFVVIQYAWPFNSLEFHETWEIRCLLLSFVGLAIRMFAAGHEPHVSSRGSKFQRTSFLNTGGVFSVARYPRYVGDYFIGLGVVLIPFVWWLAAAYTLAFYLVYRRFTAIDDEQLRSDFGQRFEDWAKTTPAILPRMSQWRPARRPFSFRAAVKLEYAGLLLVIALHSTVEWLEHLILDRRVMLELFWIVLALAGLSATLLVRYLAKHTRVLNVPAH